MCARVVCERVVGGSDVRERDVSGRVGWGRRECARVVCEKVVGERALCVCVKGLFVKELRGAEVSVQEPISVSEIAPDRPPCFKMTN